MGWRNFPVVPKLTSVWCKLMSRIKLHNFVYYCTSFAGVVNYNFIYKHLGEWVGISIV